MRPNSREQETKLERHPPYYVSQDQWGKQSTLSTLEIRVLLKELDHMQIWEELGKCRSGRKGQKIKIKEIGAVHLVQVGKLELTGKSRGQVHPATEESLEGGPAAFVGQHQRPGVTIGQRAQSVGQAGHRVENMAKPGLTGTWVSICHHR